jgi:hypothetical protein
MNHEVAIQAVKREMPGPIGGPAAFHRAPGKLVGARIQCDEIVAGMIDVGLVGFDAFDQEMSKDQEFCALPFEAGV